MSISTEIQRIMTAKANIKAAIENKGVTVGDETIDTYAEKIDEISSGGGDYEFERKCSTITFPSLNIFGKSDVVLNLDNVTKLVDLFNVTTTENANTTVEHITINCGKQITHANRIFYSNGQGLDKKLKHITLNVDLSKNIIASGMFQGSNVLEIIDGNPIDFTSCMAMSYPFASCITLVNFRVVTNSIKISFNVASSPNLSAETIQSIIDGLADLSSGAAQTLTFHATVGGKLTDEQKATITAKNWTLVY